MAYQENILEFNAVNMLTVVLMLAIAYSILGWAETLWKRRQTQQQG